MSVATQQQTPLVILVNSKVNESLLQGIGHIKFIVLHDPIRCLREKWLGCQYHLNSLKCRMYTEGRAQVLFKLLHSCDAAKRLLTPALQASTWPDKQDFDGP